MSKKSKAVDVHKIAAGKKKPTHQHNKNLAPVDPDDAKPEGGGEVIDVGKPEDFVPDAEGPTQTPLIPDSEIPVKVAVAVENDRMFATFVAPHFDTDKNGARTLALEFSFPVIDAHLGKIPAMVQEAYSYVLMGKAKRIDVRGVAEQTVDVYETSRSKKPALHLVEVAVLKPIVSEKEESGKGKTRNVIRFAFQLAVDFPNHEWAVENYGKEYWLVMRDTQASFS